MFGSGLVACPGHVRRSSTVGFEAEGYKNRERLREGDSEMEGEGVYGRVCWQGG